MATIDDVQCDDVQCDVVQSEPYDECDTTELIELGMMIECNCPPEKVLCYKYEPHCHITYVYADNQLQGDKLINQYLGNDDCDDDDDNEDDCDEE